MRTFTANLLKDIRGLLRDPAFTFPSLITLSLGIAAVTLVFTVVHHVSFSSLGLKEPGDLVTLSQNIPAISPIIPMSGQVVGEMQRLGRGRHPVSAMNLSYYSVLEEESAGRWQMARVTDNFFEVCGIVPILGRTLLPSDFSEDRRDVTLISHRFWQSLLGGQWDVIGRRIRVEIVGATAPPGLGSGLTVVGVLPPDLWLPWDDIDLISPVLPETLSPTATTPNLFALARLPSGVPVDAALQELQQSYSRIEFADRFPVEGRSLTVRMISDLHGGRIISELTLLWLASGALLLVVCANLANLVQARAARRHGEAALRFALGAGRLEAIRKPLNETLALALLGGAGGVLLSYLSLDLLRSIPTVGLPRPEAIQINGNVLVFSIGATLLSLLLFGIVPVLLESRRPLANTIQAISGRSTDGRRMGRLRSGMIVAETAIAVALLVLATAALGSLSRLQAIDTGFRADRNLIFELDLPLSRMAEPAQQTATLEGLLLRYRSIPGVNSAAIANTLPLSFTNSLAQYRTGEGEEIQRANVRRVTTQYFQAMGIPVLFGRDLAQEDIDNQRPVAVVNRKLADRHWTAGTALGKHLLLGANTRLQIVGVVGDVRQWQLTDPPEPAMYMPFQPRGSVSFILRSDLESTSLIESVRDATRQQDPNLILYSFTNLKERIQRNIGSDRLTAGLLNGFAFLCLILGAVGVYSVMSYSVAGRRREMGVRMALGAEGRQIRHLLIREGITPALIGTGIGLLGMIALSKLLESIFYEFTVLDSRLWLTGPLLLNLSAAAALWIPASKAARQDPQIALRQE